MEDQTGFRSSIWNIYTIVKHVSLVNENHAHTSFLSDFAAITANRRFSCSERAYRLELQHEDGLHA